MKIRRYFVDTVQDFPSLGKASKAPNGKGARGSGAPPGLLPPLPPLPGELSGGKGGKHRSPRWGDQAEISTRQGLSLQRVLHRGLHTGERHIAGGVNMPGHGQDDMPACWVRIHASY